MAVPDINVCVQKLLEVFDETWHGSPRPGWEEGWSYYSDARSGLEQSLAAVDAAQAQQAVGNNSIAQQVQHLAIGSRAFAGWIRGEKPQTDWPASFVLPGTLDSAGWTALQSELAAALAEARLAMVEQAALSESALTSSIGQVAHFVYHLGAIRAKLKAVISEQ